MIPANTQIWLVAGVTDMRRGFSSLAGMVQNTLDNQNIQTVTTLDVKSNSLAVLNGLNLRTSVSNAITASLRR